MRRESNGKGGRSRGDHFGLISVKEAKYRERREIARRHAGR